MSTENYEDERALLKALRHGEHYAVGAPPSASMLNMLESSMRSKFITTGGLRYGMKHMLHPSRYAQMKLMHTLSRRSRPDKLELMLVAKIRKAAKKQAYLMRTQQMLPLTFFGGKYL